VVGILTALRLATLRNSASPARTVMQVLGVVVGLTTALLTVAAATRTLTADLAGQPDEIPNAPLPHGTGRAAGACHSSE
jgi:hypothetical protein